MSFTAALNATMPQGLASSDAANWPAHPHSHPGTPTPPGGAVLSKELIASWMTTSATAPSQDLQNFVSAQRADFKLDPAATPVTEPRKRPRRGAATDDAPAKIPRPPNAFMIFRSDLIKDVRVGLQAIEKKQQNLSVIAGEIWNLMPEPYKAGWRNKATERLQEHQQKHPQYKYAPKQRNGRGKKAGKEPSPPSFADPVVRQQWRTRTLPEAFHGPAPPPSRPRRRGAQPYEVPTPSSQGRAGPSNAPEESQWHRLAMPTRPASNPADEYYPPPSIPLSEHMNAVYSRPPTAVPRSAHSSPGSTHSAPAFFPPAHDVVPDYQAPQYGLQAPIPSLLEPSASSSAMGPLPRAHSEPTGADLPLQTVGLGLLDFSSLPPLDFPAEYLYEPVSDPLGTAAFDPRANFGYGAADLARSVGGVLTDGHAAGKPESDAFSNAAAQMSAFHQDMLAGFNAYDGSAESLFSLHGFTAEQLDAMGHFGATDRAAPAA